MNSLVRTKKGVHLLTPGLTGWAQINGRDELPIPVSEFVDFTGNPFEYDKKRSLIVTTLSEQEKNAIVEALNKYGGNQTKVAKVLGISTTTLWRKIKKYKIKPQHEISDNIDN